MKHALFIFLIFFSVTAQAATYHVAKTGSAGVGCGQADWSNSARAKGTIADGFTCLSPGDTLYIHGGTYNEGIDGNNQKLPTGTAGSPTLVSNYQNESVVIQPPSGQAMNLVPTASQNPTVDYVTFNGLILDGSSQSSQSFSEVGLGLNGVRNLTFQNFEIRNFQNVNSFGIHSSCSNDVGNRCESGTTLRSVKIHDIATNISSNENTIGHGIYAALHGALIENCEIYNTHGFGIQFYDGNGGVDNNTFRNNRVYNAGVPNTQSVTGLYIGSGSNNQAYNNLVYNVHGLGIQVSSGASNSGVYQNTAYGNTEGGIAIFNSSNADVRNNIVYANGTAYGDELHNAGSGTSLANNWCTGANCAFSGNPGFVQSQNGDFHLLAGSPVINCCSRLGSVTTDLEGTPRTNPTAAGAFEGGPPPPPPQPDPLKLLAHWKFDNNALDDTQQGHDGTLSGSPAFGAPIKGTASLVFDGINDDMIVTNVADLKNANSFSIVGWINACTVDPNAGVILQVADSYTMTVQPSGQLVGGFQAGGSFLQVNSSSINVLNGLNHCVALTYDRGEVAPGLRLYDNLAQVGFLSTTATITYPGTSLVFGRYSGGGYRFIGKMDDWYIYQGQLTLEAITNICNQAVSAAGIGTTHTIHTRPNTTEGNWLPPDFNQALDANISAPVGSSFGIRFSIQNGGGL